ncbi:MULTISPECIES: HNH endonuclease signature motif containing protein [unclassified Rhodococcus (in: high G+C Gram-positive bacteria)]|uniref:HNH endonuclease signature motif containing protein n=1 Tax=unclassified Rhodococcus (in: high G+C Gram-positive bacteria) TaxID=192944 RepID=UPI0012E3454E|nr:MULTISPECIES: HNH endonuclease signature motif containing protein [unclassified Rhodococcus (in: high G+C Gram-positive bacteria)]
MDTVTVESLIADKTAAQAQHAATVLNAAEYIETVTLRELSGDHTLVPEDVEASAAAEVAAALSVSGSAVSEWRTLSASARPAVREAFAAGRLPYSAFRTVVRSLAGVPGLTEANVQEILAVAERCTTGAVAAAVDRVLARLDSAWHRTARNRATAERTLTVRRLARGQAELRLRGPQEQIAAARRAVADTARTLCHALDVPNGARLFDAAVATLTGERPACACEMPECSSRHAERPGMLACIVLDAATAAGLAGEPGHLVGWGPVPADVARALAADATWQALITSTLGEHGDTPDDIREVRRTRRHPPGWSPGDGEIRSRFTDAVDEYLDELRMLADKFPDDLARRRGPNPDGHGGRHIPPAGALTYRPTDAVAMAVTTRYSSCVHPGCGVPSADCDLDHIVPFDHSDPLRGGWTIIDNLEPLCRHHHGLKTRGQWTYRALEHGIIHIRDPRGRDYFTAPELPVRAHSDSVEEISPAPPRDGPEDTLRWSA